MGGYIDRVLTELFRNMIPNREMRKAQSPCDILFPHSPLGVLCLHNSVSTATIFTRLLIIIQNKIWNRFGSFLSSVGICDSSDSELNYLGLPCRIPPPLTEQKSNSVVFCYCGGYIHEN